MIFLNAAEMSIAQIFFDADPIIKIIILGLVFASIWSWTIIVNKVTRIRKINKLADEFEDAFWSGGSLEELFNDVKKEKNNPVVSVFNAAMEEWKQSATQQLPKTYDMRMGLVNRMEKAMYAALDKENQMISKNLGFLSSLGTNAVIVGLFGTVLGIMHSFQSIATHKNTNLSIVAPGIAEALFATAIGLAAAIPAALAYNKLIIDVNEFYGRMEIFIKEFTIVIMRQLTEEE